MNDHEKHYAMDISGKFSMMLVSFLKECFNEFNLSGYLIIINNHS